MGGQEVPSPQDAVRNSLGEIQISEAEAYHAAEQSSRELDARWDAGGEAQTGFGRVIWRPMALGTG